MTSTIATASAVNPSSSAQCFIQPYASPGKDGERDVSCWNCEVPREVPLTPTHQCDEVVNCDEINYTHQGKYRDERGVNYNSSSDASDIAQRCPECPECSVERHAALFREK